MGLVIHKHGQPRAGCYFGLRIAETPHDRQTIEDERANGGPEWTLYEPLTQDKLDDIFPDKPPPPPPPLQRASGVIIEPSLVSVESYGSAPPAELFVASSALPGVGPREAGAAGAGGIEVGGSTPVLSLSSPERHGPASSTVVPATAGPLSSSAATAAAAAAPDAATDVDVGEGPSVLAVVEGRVGEEGGDGSVGLTHMEVGMGSPGDHGDEEREEAGLSSLYIALQGWNAHSVDDKDVRFRPSAMSLTVGGEGTGSGTVGGLAGLVSVVLCLGLCVCVMFVVLWVCARASGCCSFTCVNVCVSLCEGF